ncbi:efflux RND transporter permease subunit [Qiania dongpingensis]|uniref:MMPL family transporter n=1 Tax=Qiania dongpingensis TaxID=2763669 RepID=A0A7G9G3T5_9FIRM|nr:MMPL family transporter [Qiania dongpingensis]QNM05467.1 MMPL family transporter [Qiania dongpingensis]
MKFGKAVVKYRIPILILAVLLLVPSAVGMAKTRINYDMLNYLPEDMDTVKGQDILMEDFGKGAFSFVIVEGMPEKKVAELKAKIEQVEHVDTVLWYDSILDLSVPMDLLPDKLYRAFNSGDATMMAVFFDSSTSSDETMGAIQAVREVTGEQCFVSGMSALVTDLKELCEKEEPIYVGIAVLLACAAMMIFMDNFLIPFVFLISIGMAILLNMGTNYFLGEISYLTKALSAVLQLAVTMDYSIFLWHSYSEQKRRRTDRKKAMAVAIKETLTSVIGSSVTTIAGFIALCFMSFTLGRDLGIVMAKGVILGVIGCVTTLPALILVLDKPLEKTMHKSLIPKADKVAGFVTRRFPIFLVLFVLILIPAYGGYKKTNGEVYYDLSVSLPRDMDNIIANTKLQETFQVGSTHMILADSSLSQKETKAMIKEMEDVDGVKYVLGMDSVVGSLVPEEMIPESISSILKSDKWELLLVNSEYKTASNEVNDQIDGLNAVLKKYDKNGMLIGEAPCTKDMIEVTDTDFKVVNAISIIAIFFIIAIVEKSISLPFILVAVIEFAIFINLGLPHYTNVSLPFIAPICISTIQLGATVDYAILMTTRYKSERYSGLDKKTAVGNALAASIPSIIVSALGLFAATFGVACYSDIDMISSLCNLMARGAIVSMFCVILILPAMFMLFDRVICATSIGFRKKEDKGKKRGWKRKNDSEVAL